MISDVHRRLREATREPHERLEREARVVERARSPAGRRGLAEAFHRLHQGAEEAIGPWLQGVPGLDFDARRRSSLLARDLADLGASPSKGVEHLVVLGVSEALGVMYVLEGSTLGGQVIRKALAGDDLTGLGFLDPYGARTGERWRGFLDVLVEQIQTTDDEARVVAGAHAGFAFARQCLCEVADA